MTASHITQSDFIAAALDPTAPTPDGIIGADGQTTTKRFDVYRNNIIVGLKDAMESGFPAVHSLVGDAFFTAMCGEYVRTNPPHLPMMPEYGDTFADFIDGFAPAKTLPYLADVARLEYLMRCSYHAADSTPVTAKSLQDPLLLTYKVQLSPALFTLKSAYPIVAIREAALGGNQAIGGPEDVLITRAEYDPIALSFPAGSADIITALIAGHNLMDAFDMAPETLNFNAFIGALTQGNAIINLQES